MMKDIKIHLLIVILLVSFLQSSAMPTGKLSIKIRPVFQGKPLILNDKMYVTENGDSVSIEEFKCYISSLSLQNTKGLFNEKDSYHLLNADDTSSLTFTIKNIPATQYTAFKFTIGVDSLANVTGALEGALDPTLGMFWAWNTGYINAKLVGHSSSCKTLHHAFEFHIGGYLQPYTTLRKVSLPLSSFNIEADKTTTLILQVDISTWFKQVHLVALNHVVIPSVEAMKMADNYMEMFHVLE